MRLSELFENPQDLGLPKEAAPFLELEVKIININEGKNSGIMSRCKELADYSSFVARVRTFFEEKGNLEAAIKEAIKYCSRHDILSKYLEVHGSEVLNMLYSEWNLEDAIACAREETREERDLEIARNLLTEGSTPDFIHKITGLDLETIQSLSK